MDLNVKYPDYGFENGIDVQLTGSQKTMRVFGLAKYDNGHLVIAHDYKYGDINHYKLHKFKNAIDLSTGEIITSVKDFALKINPVIFDIRPEFERIDKLKVERGLFDN